MAWAVPDSKLDETHTWQSETDRESYMRAFQTRDVEDKAMAAALMCGDRSTPNALIRQQLMSAPPMPQRLGYDRTEPGIMAAWDDAQTDNPAHSMTDFSQDPAGRTSTMRPAMEAA
jgi:hypothetical protein